MKTLEQLVEKTLAGERNLKYQNPMVRLFGTEDGKKCKNCHHLIRNNNSTFICSWWFKYAATPHRVFRKKFVACGLFVPKQNP
jgi:hypothetical protein